MSGSNRRECAGEHCRNTAPKNQKLCGPCRSHKEAEGIRERFYSGFGASDSQRADIRESDEGDAYFEAYKWALRDGIGQDTAMNIGELAAEEVENWYRREKRADTSEARMRALRRISGSESGRRQGQFAAAANLARAVQTDVSAHDDG